MKINRSFIYYGYDKNTYQNEFIKQAYDRINLTVPKGQKEIIKDHAATMGESVNSFIGRAITETIERDKEAN